MMKSLNNKCRRWTICRMVHNQLEEVVGEEHHQAVEEHHQEGHLLQGQGNCDLNTLWHLFNVALATTTSLKARHWYKKINQVCVIRLISPLTCNLGLPYLVNTLIKLGTCQQGISFLTLASFLWSTDIAKITWSFCDWVHFSIAMQQSIKHL